MGEPSKFIGERVWSTITALLRSGPKAYIAVAYLGTGAAKLLPITAGSVVVVDASEAAVKAGQTNPHELLKLYRDRHVRIYSDTGLHAKVYVCGSRAVVGSANVSRNSANHLCEAIVVLRDRKVVSDARAFVQSRCRVELGPEAIKDLIPLYRPPQHVPGVSAKSKPARLHVLPVFVGRSKEDDLAALNGRPAAKAMMEEPRRHYLEDLTVDAIQHYPTRMRVLMVTMHANGRIVVSPPATVVTSHGKHPTKEKFTCTYLELPKRRGLGLSYVMKRMGRVAKKRLLRRGPVSKHFAEKVEALFDPRR